MSASRAIRFVSSCRPTVFEVEVASVFLVGSAFFGVAIDSKSSLQQSTHVASRPKCIVGPVERHYNLTAVRQYSTRFQEIQACDSALWLDLSYKSAPRAIL